MQLPLFDTTYWFSTGNILFLAGDVLLSLFECNTYWFSANVPYCYRATESHFSAQIWHIRNIKRMKKTYHVVHSTVLLLLTGMVSLSRAFGKHLVMYLGAFCIWNIWGSEHFVFGMFCSWDVSRLGSFCSWDVYYLGCFLFGTFWGLGCGTFYNFFIRKYEIRNTKAELNEKGVFFMWDILRLGIFCLRTFCLRMFCIDMFCLDSFVPVLKIGNSFHCSMKTWKRLKLPKAWRCYSLWYINIGENKSKTRL